MMNGIFNDYDYTYLSNGKSSKCNKVLIENDMIFLFEGSSFTNSVLEILYRNFPSFIRDKLCISEEAVEVVLSKACLELDDVMRRNNISGYAVMSGLIKVNNDIYSLHVGNCNLILFSGIFPVYVTSPHSMKNKEERERIDKQFFIHRNKAEGLHRVTRFFGQYQYKIDNTYSPLVEVAKVSNRITHVFLYSSTLKVDLCDLITTTLKANKDKASTTIINENMCKYACLVILHLPMISSQNKQPNAE